MQAQTSDGYQTNTNIVYYKCDFLQCSRWHAIAHLHTSAELSVDVDLIGHRKPRLVLFKSFWGIRTTSKASNVQSYTLNDFLLLFWPMREALVSKLENQSKLEFPWHRYQERCFTALSYRTSYSHRTYRSPVV